LPVPARRFFDVFLGVLWLAMSWDGSTDPSSCGSGSAWTEGHANRCKFALGGLLRLARPHRPSGRGKTAKMGPVVVRHSQSDLQVVFSSRKRFFGRTLGLVCRHSAARIDSVRPVRQFVRCLTHGPPPGRGLLSCGTILMALSVILSVKVEGVPVRLTESYWREVMPTLPALFPRRA